MSLINRISVQHDNAPVHIAKTVEEWFAEKKIKMLANWPSQSTDLNLIECLWSELDRCIRNRFPLAKILKELDTALQEEWQKISNTVLMNLIESM